MDKMSWKEKIREYFEKNGVEIASGVALMYGNTKWYNIYLMLKS